MSIAKTTVERVTAVGVMGNVLLVVLKLFAGLAGRSSAMVSDAFHSLSDVLATFVAYLGARIDTGTPAQTAKTKTFVERGQTVLYEFAPLGTFTADRPDIGRNTEISVIANDRMTLFDKEMPSTLPTPPETPGGDPGTLSYPTTLGGLLEALCYYVGVPCATTTFLNSGLAVSKKPKQFNGATMRDVLSWIAEAACSNARFNRDGELELFWLNAVSKTYNESNYANYSQSWYETSTIDGLHIRNADSTSEYVVGTGDNAYMIQDNPFLRQSD